jgi:hypothetical protein
MSKPTTRATPNCHPPTYPSERFTLANCERVLPPTIPTRIACKATRRTTNVARSANTKPATLPTVLERCRWIVPGARRCNTTRGCLGLAGLTIFFRGVGRSGPTVVVTAYPPHSIVTKNAGFDPALIASHRRVLAGRTRRQQTSPIGFVPASTAFSRRNPYNKRLHPRTSLRGQLVCSRRRAASMA